MLHIVLKKAFDSALCWSLLLYIRCEYGVDSLIAAIHGLHKIRLASVHMNGSLTNGLTFVSVYIKVAFMSPGLFILDLCELLRIFLLVFE